MQHYLYVERDFGAGQKNTFQKQEFEVFSWTSFLFLNSILNQEAVESITLLKSYWYSASEPVFNASDWIRLLRLIKQLFNHEFTLKGFFFLKLQTQVLVFSKCGSVVAILYGCVKECLHLSSVYSSACGSSLGCISSKGLNVRLSSLSILGGRREKWTQFSQVHPNAEPFWIYVTITLNYTVRMSLWDFASLVPRRGNVS